MAYKPATARWLPVPARDLPACHLIAEDDLTMVPFSPRQVEDGMLRDPGARVGRLTLEPLSAGRPVRQEQVVAVSDPALVWNTVAIDIAPDVAGFWTAPCDPRMWRR